MKINLLEETPLQLDEIVSQHDSPVSQQLGGVIKPAILPGHSLLETAAQNVL